jgi:hypothetical protein
MAVVLKPLPVHNQRLKNHEENDVRNDASKLGFSYFLDD